MVYDLKLEHTISKEMSIYDTYYSDVLSDPLYEFDVDFDIIYIEADNIENELEDVIVKRFWNNDITTFDVEVEPNVKFQNQYIETANEILYVENEFIIDITVIIKMNNSDYKLLILKDVKFIEMIKDTEKLKEEFEDILS